MKRIAFVSDLGMYAWGGSEELWSQTAWRFLRKGYAVEVGVDYRSQPAKQLVDLKRGGAVVHEERGWWDYSEFRRACNKFLGLIRGSHAKRSFRWLADGQHDLLVLSLSTFWSDLSAAAIALERGIPYVLVIQAATRAKWPVDEVIEATERIFAGAKYCAFVSEANLHDAELFFGRELPNARIVRNPFLVDYETSLEWPSEESGFRLACVGRLEPAGKGQDILFDVLRQAHWRERPLNVSLFGAGAQERALRRLREYYSISSVSFVGFVSSVQGIWAGHHALILPSRVEGLPLAIVEAMLCARPCIVTDVAGNTELLRDNETGFIAAAPTVALLDEALERAWAKRDRWKAIGIAACEAVRTAVPGDPVGNFVGLLEELLMVRPSFQSGFGEGMKLSHLE